MHPADAVPAKARRNAASTAAVSFFFLHNQYLFRFLGGAQCRQWETARLCGLFPVRSKGARASGSAGNLPPRVTSCAMGGALASSGARGAACPEPLCMPINRPLCVNHTKVRQLAMPQGSRGRVSRKHHFPTSWHAGAPLSGYCAPEPGACPGRERPAGDRAPAVPRAERGLIMGELVNAYNPLGSGTRRNGAGNGDGGAEFLSQGFSFTWTS